MSKSTEGNIRLNLPQLLLIWADMAKRFSNCDVASKQYPRDKDDPKYKKNPYFTVDRRTAAKVRRELLVYKGELPDIIQKYRRGELRKKTWIKTSDNNKLRNTPQTDKFVKSNRSPVTPDTINNTSKIFENDSEKHDYEVKKSAGILISEMGFSDELLQHLSPHQINAREADLTAHIQSSEFSSVWTAMEERNQIREYFIEQWMYLLSTVVNDVDDGNNLSELMFVNSKTLMRGQKPIIFPKTMTDLRRAYQFDEVVCINAIDLARGVKHEQYLSYSIQQGYRCYELKSGNYIIAILGMPYRKSMVKSVVKLNEEMSIRYSKHEIAQKIGEMISDLEKLEYHIKIELEKFIQVKPLAGRCDSCPSS
jgi:hypothetical protein